MFSNISRRAFAARTLLSLAIAATSLTATACGDDDPTGVEDEPAVTQMRLTFSNGQTLTITGTGSPTLRIPVGTTTVTAQFLRADGTVDPLAVAPTFRLQVNVPTGNVSYAANPSNAFAGTFTATTATDTAIPITFGLLHVEENHTDFGPFTVQTTVGN